MKKYIFVLGASFISTGAIAQIVIFPGDDGFVDISATGTNLQLGDDGEANFNSTVGNPVFAPGPVRVGNNGGIAFGVTNGDLDFTNNALPGAGGVGGVFANSVPANPQTLLAYWDDIDSETGGVFWQEIGEVLYVQWNNRSHFPGPTDVATFQIKVFSSGPYLASFVYQNIEGQSWNGGASATIGYLDGTSGANGGNNIQWSFDTPFSVTNGSSLVIVPEPATIGVLAIGGLGLLLRKRRR